MAYFCYIINLASSLPMMIHTGHTLKSLILEVLAEKVFANAKEIQYLVGKYHKKTTHQAIYKALNGLIRDGVVTKTQHGCYTFSLTYLQYLESLTSKIKEGSRLLYNAEDYIHKLDEGEVLSWPMASIAEGLHFARELIMSILYYHQNDIKDTYHFYNHFGTILFPSAHTFMRMSKHNQWNIHTFLYGTTAVDRMAHQKMKGYGVESYRVKDAFLDGAQADYTIVDDYVLTVEYHSRMHRDWSALIKKQDPDRGPSDAFFDYFYHKEDGNFLSISLEKDAAKAERLRQKMHQLV